MIFQAIEIDDSHDDTSSDDLFVHAGSGASSSYFPASAAAASAVSAVAAAVAAGGQNPQLPRSPLRKKTKIETDMKALLDEIRVITAKIKDEVRILNILLNCFDC